MNNLALLKEKQNVVYNIINNSLKQNKLAHAYLFSGVANSLQFEMAELLAQNLVCQSESEIACGTCNSCLRIINNTYPDYIILDGSDHLIKKDEVIDLQQRFSMTAFEEASAKIFIIKAADNMTASAANSLLKFLEEPSDNVLGILISDDLDSILPTIKSRCTDLSFNELSYMDNYNLALAKGISARDAYYYSRIVSKYYDCDSFMDSEAYLLFKDVFEEYLNQFIRNPHKSLVYIQTYLIKNSNKTLVNEVSRMFLDALVVFFNDILTNVDVDEYYNNRIEVYRNNINYLALLEVVLEIKNKVANHINLALLMDQMFYQFLEVLS